MSKDYFEGTEFNTQTKDILNNFVDEFDLVCGKYLSKEEVVNRLKENLISNIEVKEIENKNILGKYNYIDKTITIAEGIAPKRIKSILFHELVHCITNNEGLVGLEQLYADVTNGKKYKIGVGFNEGATEYVTKLRDELIDGKRNNETSYPILVNSIENVVEVVGKDNFLKIAFNNPENIEDLLEENFDLIDSYDEAENFIRAFDIVYKHENKLFSTKENKLILAIFGMKEKVDDIGVNQAVQIILETLSENIYNRDFENLENFNDAYEKIAHYNDCFSIRNFETFLPLYIEFEEYVDNRGIDITKLSVDDINQEYLAHLKYVELVKRDKKQILESIQNGETREILDMTLSTDAYKRNLVSAICCGYSEEQDSTKYDLLENGLAKMILDNGYNIEELEIEELCLQLDNDNELLRNIHKKNIFNLYLGIGNEKRYLKTIYNVYNEGKTEIQEFKKLDEERRNEFNGSYGIIPEDVVLMNENEDLLIFSEDFGFKLVDIKDREFVEEGDVKIYFCPADIVMKKLEEQIEKSNITILESAFFPKSFNEMLNATRKQEIIKSGSRLEKNRFLPSNIENVTLEVALEEIEEIMSRITEGQKSNEELFKEGVGYGRD